MSPIESFSTRTLPPRARADSWKQHLESSLFEAEYGLLGGEDLSADHTVLEMGPNSLHSFSVSRHSVDRTNSHLAKMENRLFLTTVLAGKACFWSDSTMFVAEPGDVLVYDPDSPFFIAFHDNTQELLFDVSRQELESASFESWSPRKIDAGILHAAGLGLAELTNLFSIIRKGNGFPSDSDVASKRALDVLLNEISEEGAASYFRQALAVIRRDLHKSDLSLGSIAAEISLSVRHMSRVFQEHGTSVAQTIIAARMQHASVLLQTTAIPVSAVSVQSGFSSVSHFTRTFSRFIGTSPSAFREAKR